MPTLPTLSLAPVGGPRADRLVAAGFEREPPTTAGLPTALGRRLRELAARRGFAARAEQMVADERDGMALELHGLGSRATFDRAALGAWLRRVVAQAERNGDRRLAVCLPDDDATTETGAPEATLAALALAVYRFERYRSPGPRSRLREIQVVVASKARGAYRDALGPAGTLADGVAYARDLANTPPNDATPEWMASQARGLARSYGLRARVLGPSELRRLGMGGILAVGAGSEHPPRLVRLEYGRRGPIVALVGKGVTFDTGGISIKPAASMEDMKYDKSGACTVLGILRVAAELRLPLRLRAYLPLAENMLAGGAYRPGDIVRCYNGKTVEIHNTDAEGRLILADALAWAAQEKPDALLEFSTLTGACVVALGHGAAGLYTPEDDLAGELLGAAQESGERLWRLPLWPEFVVQMKGHHADLKNSGGRWGGANTAAAFLSQFVGSLRRWAHLDIAGPAYVGTEGPGTPGATGYGIAFTLRWLRALASTR